MTETKDLTLEDEVQRLTALAWKVNDENIRRDVLVRIKSLSQASNTGDAKLRTHEFGRVDSSSKATISQIEAILNSVEDRERTHSQRTQAFYQWALKQAGDMLSRYGRIYSALSSSQAQPNERIALERERDSLYVRIYILLENYVEIESSLSDKYQQGYYAFQSDKSKIREKSEIDKEREMNIGLHNVPDARRAVQSLERQLERAGMFEFNRKEELRRKIETAKQHYNTIQGSNNAYYAQRRTREEEFARIKQEYERIKSDFIDGRRCSLDDRRNIIRR